MRSNQKHSAKELEKFIQLNLEGVSYRDLQESYGLLLSETVFRQYRLKYLEYGLSALESHKHNQSYSQSFKEAVVKEHLETQTPIEQLARKYQIPAASTVRNWLIKYTKGEENNRRKIGDCQSNIVDKGKFYGCSGYKDGCKFTLPKKWSSKTIPRTNIIQLIEKGETTEIKGFKSKKGNKFKAKLKLEDEKLQFVFDN